MIRKPPTMNPTPVRLPDDLRDYLKTAAAANRRSLTGEITHRLDLSRKADEQATAKEPQQ